MRILFASTQGAGHFTPLVPFVEAARRAGHEVLVVGPPTLDAGAYPFRAGASPPPEILGPVWERMPTLPPGQGDVVVVGQIFAGLNVEAMLPTFDEVMEEWRPDLVVREPSEYASAIAAERHGVRHVRVAISLALVDEGGLAFAAPALEDRRPGVVGRIAASPYLSCFPASLDPPSFPVARYRDPAADAPPSPLPDWWPGDERPLVYLTFGSVAGSFATAGRLFGAAAAAVAGLPVRVLLTVGREVELGPLPANVHVERWVPQRDVLPSAAAVVCHGGSGTTVGALAAGRPLVIVPLFADQPHNAARVAGAGAGVAAAIDGIGASLGRVLERPAYADAARRIAAEMRALPAADDVLARYLAGASAAAHAGS